MLDKYNRNISYLRISVTDRCNLRCTYCMPEEGIDLIAHEEMLSFEQIINFVEEAVKTGITKIRLTGGEPLVRKGIIDLVRLIANVQGVEDLALTTNGILLEKYAEALAQAGLKRVNISLDTLNPAKYREITRCGDINDVFKGIDAAKKAGLTPIKINCVRMPDSSETELITLKEFCQSNGLDLRFIRQMDLESGDFSIVEGGEGGNCKICNRIRLTANGKVKPCLFNNNEFDIKKLGAKDAIKKTIESKPQEGSQNKIGKFYNIGG
ncbi:GTP 3',8-cyclase MoaA [Ancylomarina salipaludis]|uniref:GTP 3',8-cyclase n=1 Tax=Ancylomarina salipaludis TaxID=2501299 RepID=A0A4V1N071_9BACT|nr:GTP 3',8-cyclase MoaA [Ancylomarina salipaludis]RXQ95542.1 GTP 3',8-cyclase MoaA [Ancylomarina salipaludis]